MKKAMLLMFALVMCLSLCACGGDDITSEPTETSSTAISPTSLLTNTNWKGAYTIVNDVRANFREDGTGTFYGCECTWELYDGVVTVMVQAQYGEAVIEYTIVEYNGTTMLCSASGNLLPASNYNEAHMAMREYMCNVADELDWTTAYQEKLSNGARAALEYEGKIVKWTATVYEIGSTYAQMAVQHKGGLPVNSVYVYMDTEDLAKLNNHQEFTVVGVLSIKNGKIYSGSVLE